MIIRVLNRYQSENSEIVNDDTTNSNTSYESIPTEYSEILNEDTTDSDTSFESIASEDLEEELVLQEEAIEQMEEEIAIEEIVLEDIALDKENKTMFTVSNEKRALVIGINYNEDQFQGDDLQGCVNDMNNIKQVLRERCYFLEDDITTLKKFGGNA